MCINHISPWIRKIHGEDGCNIILSSAARTQVFPTESKWTMLNDLRGKPFKVIFIRLLMHAWETVFALQNIHRLYIIRGSFKNNIHILKGFQRGCGNCRNTIFNPIILFMLRFLLPPTWKSLLSNVKTHYCLPTIASLDNLQT